MMTGDGREKPSFRHIVVLAGVLAARSGVAWAARYFMPGGRLSTPGADIRATAKDHGADSASHADNHPTRARGEVKAASTWSDWLALVYLWLLPVNIPFLFLSVLMAANSGNYPPSKNDILLWTVIYCAWLTPPAQICSFVGLARGHKARWLKLLPACTFGVAIMMFNMLRFDIAHPRVVVAGSVSCVGALLFSDRRGSQAAIAVCGVLTACLFVFVVL